MQWMRPSSFGRIGAAALLALLASCATPPPPPPPPPPPVAAIPARPMPPSGASELTPIPLRDAFGARRTVNSNITPAQATWNLRSAFNVAALNCPNPQNAAILDGYKRFLKTHEKGLSATYKAVDKEWRSRTGTDFVRERETYSTRVYNYFALPPVLPRFCGEMGLIAAESLAVAPKDLDDFSARSLTRVEGVFEQFFQEFEQYRKNAADWDATYGARRDPYASRSSSPAMPNGPAGAVSN